MTEVMHCINPSSFQLGALTCASAAASCNKCYKEQNKQNNYGSYKDRNNLNKGSSKACADDYSYSK